jgi:hypothetical protein
LGWFLKKSRGGHGFFKDLRVLCIEQYFSVVVAVRLHGVPLYAVFAVHFRRFWFMGVSCCFNSFVNLVILSI